MREVILAEKAGFCFGVKRAVDAALNTQKKYNKKIYTLGPLIHNNDVVEYLKQNNIFPIDLSDINILNKDDVVIIRSHGVSEKTINILKEQNLIIEDTTCPYVENIHKKVKEHSELGYQIVIVGDKDHPEVIGTNGWCNDEAIISKDGSNIGELPSKVCLVSQTTEKQANWQKVLEKVKENSQEVIAINTICNATEVRQKSAEDISKKVDAMVVIGGYDSSNTTKLYEICKANCENTIHVENSGGIPDNIKNFKNISKIGVTAGASTPDWIIKEAISKMNNVEDLNLNEQLAFMEQNDVQIAVGKSVKGEIISLNDKEAFVNIGYKADGYLPLREVTSNEDVKMTDLFKVGDTVEAKIINRSSEDGYVVLSRIEIERAEAYTALKDAVENKKPIIVEIKKVVKGGLIASFKGARVFIPASHIEFYHIENLEQYVGKDMEVLVTEFTDGRNTKIVCSRRELLVGEKVKLQEKTWGQLEKDTVVEGIVRRISAFGAFVEINGVDGLLHVSEISWAKVSKPSEVLKIGETIKVYILDVDKENKKLSLSLKKLKENPWKDVAEKYPVGNIVLGKVVRFTKFGAFVELESGVDGLIHISQISHNRIEKPEQVLKIGEQVKAKILEVSEENKKIALSTKDMDEF